MSQALHPMLNTAIKAARNAGVIINRASLDLDLLKVNTKSPNDFVIEVDHKAEAEAGIIETLLDADRCHSIPADDSGRTQSTKRTASKSRSSTRSTAPPTSFTASSSTRATSSSATCRCPR